jgi:hypothetical protein
LSNNDWMKIQEWFEKQLRSWKGKKISIGARLTVINSVLSSCPCTWCPSSKSHKGFAKSWIVSVLFFFGSVRNTK